MSINPANISNLSMEITIDAGADAVWAALTKRIGDWWPAEFYAGGSEGARDFTLDPTPGGRMVETYSDGGGALWGTVIAAETGARLQVLGALFPNWGGPTQWFGTWDLKPSGNGTTLTYSESAIGNVSDDGTAEKIKGWNFLWATLKAHVEGKPAPAWVD